MLNGNTGTIVYVSQARENLTTKEVENIFELTLQNNIDLEITGILMYSERTFLQVLEGEYPIIKSLFKTIEEDHRHENIIKLVDIEHGNRIFNKYKTGFSIITGDEDATQVKLLIQHALDKDENKEIAEKLNYFIA